MHAKKVKILAGKGGLKKQSNYGLLRVYMTLIPKWQDKFD